MEKVFSILIFIRYIYYNEVVTPLVLSKKNILFFSADQSSTASITSTLTESLRSFKLPLKYNNCFAKLGKKIINLEFVLTTKTQLIMLTKTVYIRRMFLWCGISFIRQSRLVDVLSRLKAWADDGASFK